MFNVNEAVDELIDDINVDYYESCYDAIYEELCDRVDYGELTLEEAEMINDAAAYKYLYEAKNVDKALEEDDDDDKKKKESDKNIKKKINKKKVAVGVGLAAAGAGALAYGGKYAIKYARNKYEKDADNSYLNFKKAGIDRDTYNPRSTEKIYGPDFVDDDRREKFHKAIKNQKDIYKKANKLGKKRILDSLQTEREVNRQFRKLEKSDQ